MSRFNETKKDEYVRTADQRMAQASQQLAAFSQSVLDVSANWYGYASLETDQAELLSTAVEFRAKNRQLVDDRKTALAHALDVIAGGMANEQGEPLTRQDILDELAAVPAAE